MARPSHDVFATVDSFAISIPAAHRQRYRHPAGIPLHRTTWGCSTPVRNYREGQPPGEQLIEMERQCRNPSESCLGLYILRICRPTSIYLERGRSRPAGSTRGSGFRERTCPDGSPRLMPGDRRPASRNDRYLGMNCAEPGRTEGAGPLIDRYADVVALDLDGKGLHALAGGADSFPDIDPEPVQRALYGRAVKLPLAK